MVTKGKGIGEKPCCIEYGMAQETAQVFIYLSKKKTPYLYGASLVLLLGVLFDFSFSSRSNFKPRSTGFVVAVP